MKGCFDIMLVEISVLRYVRGVMRANLCSTPTREVPLPARFRIWSTFLVCTVRVTATATSGA